MEISKLCTLFDKYLKVKGSECYYIIILCLSEEGCFVKTVWMDMRRDVMWHF